MKTYSRKLKKSRSIRFTRRRSPRLLAKLAKLAKKDKKQVLSGGKYCTNQYCPETNYGAGPHHFAPAHTYGYIVCLRCGCFRRRSMY